MSIASILVIPSLYTFLTSIFDPKAKDASIANLY